MFDCWLNNVIIAIGTLYSSRQTAVSFNGWSIFIQIGCLSGVNKYTDLRWCWMNTTSETTVLITAINIHYELLHFPIFLCLTTCVYQLTNIHLSIFYFRQYIYIGVNPPVPTGSLPFSRPCLPVTPVSRFSPVFSQNLPMIFLKYDVIHF